MLVTAQRVKVVLVGLGIAVVCIVAAEFIRGAVTRDREPLTPFKSDVGRFKVMLPAAVSTETDQVETTMGPVRQTMYKARAKYIQFLVAYTDYPDQYMATTKPADILAGAARSAASGVNGKLKREEAFVSNGLATRQVWVRAPKGVHMRSRLTLVGSRMYQVTALAQRRHVFDRKIEDVFASFEVLPAPAAAPTAPDSATAGPQTAAGQP